MATRRNRARDQIKNPPLTSGQSNTPDSLRVQSRFSSGPESAESAGDDVGTRRDRDTAELFSQALRLLSNRGYSESELRQRLKQRAPVDPEALEVCVTRLKELGYLDDRRFARSYANHRIALRPFGRARLARELAAKRVDRTLIDETLDQVFEENDEEIIIDRAIRRHIRVRGSPQTKADMKRLFDHLMRSGFEYDAIVRKLREIERSGER